VRHLALGQLEGIDRRVSAAFAPDGQAALAFTFLGRQHGRAGREMEQALGVLVRPDLRTTVLENMSDWMPAPDAAAPSKEMWERHFASWGSQAQEAAGAAARGAFQKIAESFARAHKRLVEEEQRRLDDWLRGRADEICDLVKDERLPLFDALDPTEPRTPFERLQQFFSRQQSGSKARAEAESVLRFYERRRGQLQERGELRAPEVVPLGMLMLVPRGKS
jgi:hypothetical protein